MGDISSLETLCVDILVWSYVMVISTSFSPKQVTKVGVIRRRSAARLAAVQALYQIALTGSSPGSVVEDILEKRIAHLALADAENEREIPIPLIEPDVNLFSLLVHIATALRYEIDTMTNKILSNEWQPERLEVIVRCILRAGISELLERFDVPVRVIINEYVDVAHAFYSGSEPGLVNAVLDRLGRYLRTHEFHRSE